MTFKQQIIMNKLRCSRCNQIKSIENFGLARTFKKGRKYLCKDCDRIYLKEYRCKHREAVREYDRKRYAQNREYLLKQAKKYKAENREKVTEWRKKYYKERKLRALQKVSGLEEPICQNCGCDDLRLLEVHHKNGGGYKEKKSKAIAEIYNSILNGKRKIEDLQVLCKLCNCLCYAQMKYGNIPMKVIWIKNDI